jgi:alpha-L-rhamnosidase
MALLVLALVSTTAPRTALVQSALGVTALKTEYAVDPIGIDALRPRFSWQLTATARAQMQSAYRVLVASSPADLDADRGDKWDSGRVTGDRSNQIEYGGSPLASRTRYYWKVQVWDRSGVASAWSGRAFFEMGLVGAGDWTARFIAEPNVTAKSPLLRKAFSITKPVRRARVYATALGVYELHLNGQRVGQDYLSPGWTAYSKRLEYQTYDVTSLMVSGRNAIGAVVGNGWYAGEGVIQTPVLGTTRSVRVQLEIEYDDNTRARVDSDRSWRVWVDGAIRSSSIDDGEVYDARKELPGWSSGTFVDEGWSPAREVESYKGQLVPGSFPIRVMQEQPAVAVTTPARGTHIFDLGQNIVGWARLSVRGAAGTRIHLRFAEALDRDGTLYTANLRGAAQTDSFILRGTGGEEVFEPHFTYHGFRYVEVTGFPGTPKLGAVTGRVVYAALDATGTLTTSSSALNRLYQAIVWSQRGNFYSVPTLCPARDERTGSTAEGQVFAATAALNMDVARYFTKWSQDIEDEQLPSGAYPMTAPVASRPLPPSSGWQEAGVVIPWTLYQSYGDTRIIDQRWSSMARFIDYLRSRVTDQLLPGDTSVYGDAWAFGESVPKVVLANAYYAYSVKLMAEMARATGRSTEAHAYDALLKDIRSAFLISHVTADGQVSGGTQTGSAMAIVMDMIPPDRVAATANYLVSNIRSRANHPATGFIGGKDLLNALSQTGHTAVAYDLITQTSFPSWLFEVENGATTLWERWDGLTPAGCFQDPSMNSFNHYRFGAVGEWMFGVVAGIRTDPEKPGYKAIVIHPRPGGGLTSARAEYQSIHGPIATEWSIVGSTFTLKVTIPANTTATVYVPTGNAATVREGNVLASGAAGVKFLRMEGKAAVYSVGSGHYEMSSDLTGTGPAPAATAAPGTWTFCTNEGSGASCAFTGTRQVRFGADGRYAYGTFTSSVPCSNGVFGDPAPGVLKRCDYNDASVPIPWWTPGRALAVLAAAGALLLAGLVWIGSLQRTVNRQTEVIRERLARETVLAERSRIAREVHDGLAQAIAAVSIHLEGIRSVLPTTAVVALDRLDATRSLVRQTLADASRSIWEVGLPTEASGLENVVREMLKRFGADVPIELSVDGREPSLTVHTEYHVARIAQEAVANALRHAQGSRIQVRLSFPEGRVLLRVNDDGPGFDLSQSPPSAGLSGMRERASLLKGELRVRSSPGSGTEVSLEVPAGTS